MVATKNFIYTCRTSTICLLLTASISPNSSSQTVQVSSGSCRNITSTSLSCDSPCASFPRKKQTTAILGVSLKYKQVEEVSSLIIFICQVLSAGITTWWVSDVRGHLTMLFAT